MNKFIAKHIFFNPIQNLRGQHVQKYLQQVKDAQYLTLPEIHEYRDRKLRNIIKYAYQNTDFYRKCFDDLGIKPDDVRTIKDLSRLPILSKMQLLEKKEELYSHQSTGRLYTRKTGGSTGITLYFRKEADALALNDAIMYRCYDWYDIDIGDRQVRFWGVPVNNIPRIKERVKDFVLNRIRISAFDISEETCLKQFEKILRFKPAYFYGYTTAIFGFCIFAKKLGLDLKQLDLKAIICTAEKMYPHHLALFNEMFECPVVDEYGSSENGIIAFQCRCGKMHMMSDHMCIEFIDDKGMSVRPGDPGRIVITDLASYAMPLIRYDIGDIGRPSEEQCRCGINLPLMDIVEGRKEDFIQTKSGKLIHAAYLCYTLKEKSVHEFKMFQKDMDSFFIQIVKSPSFNEGSEKILEENLRSELGKEVKITFEYLERIPRESSGKLRYFVSEMNN